MSAHQTPLFACYEKNFANRWQLIVYHGEKPGKSVNANDAVRSETFFNVPDELRGENGDPMFSAIRTAFPAPRG